MNAPPLLARLRRALSALLPHVVLVPLMAGLTFVVTSVMAALGTGSLLAAFVAMLQRVTHTSGGHGYGIILAFMAWVAILAAGATAAVSFVVFCTWLATSVAMVISGLIDLVRLPRGVARTDTHYPKLWGAWSALVMTLLMVILLGARRIAPERVHEIDLVFVSLAAAPVCVFAMVVGLIVRSATRGRARRGGVAPTP